MLESPSDARLVDKDLQRVLDTEHGHTIRSQSVRTYNRTLAPGLRVVQALFVICAVSAQFHWSSHTRPSPTSFLIYCTLLGLYVSAAWLISWVAYDRAPAALPLTLTAGDLCAGIAAIHLTGGLSSWLFPILGYRIFDPPVIIRFSKAMRVLGCGVAAIGVYAAYWIWQAGAGVPFDAPLQVLKILALGAVTLCYSVQTAWTEQIASLTPRLLELSRELVADLRTQIARNGETRRVAEIARRAQDNQMQHIVQEFPAMVRSICALQSLIIQAPLSPDREHLALHVYMTLRRLSRGLDDLETIWRIDCGADRMQLDPFKPRTTIEHVVAAFVPHARERNIHLTLSFEEAVPDLCLGDGERVAFVLCKLLDNAFKFTERGKVAVRVDFTPHDDMLRLEVEDTGRGLTLPQLALVTRLFYRDDPPRGDAPREPGYDGNGLGLAAAERQVWLMAGRLRASGEPGVGARFSFSARAFRLPPELAGGPDPDPPPLAEVLRCLDERWARQTHATLRLPPVADDSRPRDRILIVEAHPSQREVTVRLVEGAGGRAICHESLPFVLEALTFRRFHLCLIACRADRDDGFEMARRVVQRWPQTHPPIVGMAMSNVDICRRRARGCGMAAFVKAPQSIEEMRALIHEWATPPADRREDEVTGAS